MANTTWNPSDKSASITLSNGNLTMSSSTTFGGIRAIDRQITGKFYWEVTATTWGASCAIGVAAQGASLAGAAPALWCYALQNGGNVFLAGASTGVTLGTRANGDIIGVALDLVNQLIWFRVAPSGNWNGSATANPATGVGGVSIQTIAGVGAPLYPYAYLQGSGQAYTANFGDSAFTGAVPAGFTSGFTAGANPPLNVIATQAALEHFFATNPPAQVTQVTVEQWATTATISGQAIVTTVALEQWVPAAKPPVELAGNLGGASHYGKLKYGLKNYSRIDAFAPIFSADITVVAPLNLAGDLTPTIVLAADLDVHVNLIKLRRRHSPSDRIGRRSEPRSVRLDSSVRLFWLHGRLRGRRDDFRAFVGGQRALPIAAVGAVASPARCRRG